MGFQMNTPGVFTAPELRNSRPFDPARRCVGAGGEGLVSHVLGMIADGENRTRALRKRDAETREASVSSLLANLAAAAMNRVDDQRFVAVSFNVNDYSGTGLSHTAMTLARDALVHHGLVEGAYGIRRPDQRVGGWSKDGWAGARRHGFNPDREAFGQLSRWRATDALRDLIGSYGCDRRSIRAAGSVVVLRDPEPAAGDEPAAVWASRTVLARVNDRLAKADITLPDSEWANVRAQLRAGDRANEERDAGDMTAKSLRRIFRRAWDRGGRLYGGWWQSLPASARSRLVIDGEAVTELDFEQLHPALLYARLGRPLASDVYDLPPYPRELGKLAFNHLLNTIAEAGAALPTRLPPRSGRGLLPKGVAYRQFLEAYLASPAVEPITPFLRRDEGTRLQREDSDLAVNILARLDDVGVVALPVHDSFIVRHQHAAALREVMLEEFARVTSVPARVRISTP